MILGTKAEQDITVLDNPSNEEETFLFASIKKKLLFDRSKQKGLFLVGGVIENGDVLLGFGAKNHKTGGIAPSSRIMLGAPPSLHSRMRWV